MHDFLIAVTATGHLLVVDVNNHIFKVHESASDPENLTGYLPASALFLGRSCHLCPNHACIHAIQLQSTCQEVFLGITKFCKMWRLTGEGMLEEGPDRHEQLKLQAQKQALLGGNSCVAPPTCCSVDAAESNDEQEDLDALMY